MEEEDEVGELQVPSTRGSRRSSAAKKEEEFVSAISILVIFLNSFSGIQLTHFLTR